MTSSTIFQDILYAQCWEDPELDRAAFGVGPGATVFTITSGGCNALAFLADHPDRVIAADLNASQNHLTELKQAAFRALGRGDLLELMGVRDSGHRHDMYQTLRTSLSGPARAYWDGQPHKIAQGLIHCGRYERYMGLLRAWTRRVMGRRLIEEFFEEDDPHRRAELFATRWDTLAWKLLTRVLLSRRTMTMLFDGAFFRYVEGDFSFGGHFARRVAFALTVLPPRENPFLSYILLGRYFNEEHLPTYLRAEHHVAIRQGLDRLSVHTASCADFFRTLPEGAITHFNFTNIFEWLDQAAFERLLRETHRVAVPGATLTYRNLLVHRERPESLAALFEPDRPRAQALHACDRSFIYRNYVVERVLTPRGRS
jgi:S-adenosylmethionine-diacylglycerol 3-amino-3-carboxypropyl transferase